MTTKPDIRTVLRLPGHRDQLARWYHAAVCAPAWWEREEHRDEDRAVVDDLLRDREASASAGALDVNRLAKAIEKMGHYNPTTALAYAQRIGGIYNRSLLDELSILAAQPAAGSAEPEQTA